MDRFTQRFRPQNSHVASYGCCYPDRNCRDHSLDTVGAVSAPDGATTLLCDYSKSLGQFAGLIGEFRRKIPETDMAGLPAVARGLIPGIVAVNAAYLHLSMASDSLSVDLPPRTGAGKKGDIACVMREIERFQWTEYRSQLNELLVPVLAIWNGAGEPDTLATVKAHLDNDTGVASSWETLATTLRGEADAVRADIGDECTRLDQNAGARSDRPWK